MFPAGVAGIALLLLRFSVAAALISILSDRNFAIPVVIISGAVLLVPALCLGFMTPYAAILCAIAELCVVLNAPGQVPFPDWIAILNCAILSMLGPGAYSFDCRMFGRKILTLPPRSPKR